MEIKSKFSLGDRVYFLKDDRFQSGMISALYTTSYFYTSDEIITEIKYKVKGHILPENQVFGTKQEMIDSQIVKDD